MPSSAAELAIFAGPFGVKKYGFGDDDVHKLIKIIREKVYEKNQIVLESEVKMWP